MRNLKLTPKLNELTLSYIDDGDSVSILASLCDTKLLIKLSSKFSLNRNTFYSSALLNVSSTDPEPNRQIIQSQRDDVAIKAKLMLEKIEPFLQESKIVTLQDEQNEPVNLFYHYFLDVDIIHFGSFAAFVLSVAFYKIFSNAKRALVMYKDECIFEDGAESINLIPQIDLYDLLYVPFIFENNSFIFGAEKNLGCSGFYNYTNNQIMIPKDALEDDEQDTAYTRATEFSGAILAQLEEILK